jgi:hypothetical protein
VGAAAPRRRSSRGEESARLAEYWFDRQPQAVEVARNAEGEPLGFVLLLALHRTTEADRATDPAVARTWAYLERHAPLREGEPAVLEASPHDRRAYRAVHRTYLQPAGTQAPAAELLDLPMSTFRRRLAAGLERLTALLWQEELDVKD